MKSINQEATKNKLDHSQRDPSNSLNSSSKIKKASIGEAAAGVADSGESKAAEVVSQSQS